MQNTKLKTPEEPKKKLGFKHHLEGWIWTIVVVFLIRAFIIQPYKVPTGSMEDTILPGDFLLAAKFVYGIEIPYTHIKFFDFYKPQRKSMVIFTYPVDMKRDFVKRCIGIPGDTIIIKDKILYINGKEQVEDYVVHKSQHNIPPVFQVTDEFTQKEFQHAWEERNFLNDERVRDNFGPIIVPLGTIFVMGDNRDHSLDSRFWGPLPLKLVKGLPLIIYLSWDNDPPLFRIWEKIRWLRMFKLLLFV